MAPAGVAVQVGQREEGLRLVAEALAAFETSGRGDLLAEAYRLQGVLLLHQAGARVRSGPLSAPPLVRPPRACLCPLSFCSPLSTRT
jgi:hypothetical protein